MKSLMFFLILFFVTFSSYGQIKYGLSIGAAYSDLEGISEAELAGHGFSGNPFTTKTSPEFFLGSFLIKDLNKFFAFETGLGFASERNEVEISYRIFSSSDVEKANLNMNLVYLEIPLLLNYTFFKNINTQEVKLSGGIIPKFLIIHQDNYQDIILEKPAMTWNPYRRVILNSYGSVNYTQIFNSRLIELSIFKSFTHTPFAKGWGFYENLYFARNQQTGIKIKYFFNTILKN